MAGAQDSAPRGQLSKDNDNSRHRQQGPRVADHGQSLAQWRDFMSRCISSRLDPETFDSYVVLLQSKHPLPIPAIADICLRPQASNHESLDPRIPRYVQVLVQRGLINTPSILTALYKYSSSQALADQQQQQQQNNAGQDNLGASNGAGGGGQKQQQQQKLLWRSSYAAEEVIFYRLTKAVGLGSGIKNAGDAIQVCGIMARWMTLFTSASSAFAQQDLMMAGTGMGGAGAQVLLTAQSRDEMEAARAAFVMLLLSVCENPTVLNALAQPYAKDVRKALSASFATFVPSILQSASQIAGRLEQFRTETLASFDPVEKDKDIVKSDMDELLDSTIGLESFVVPDMPVMNSRAGLYVYLNAALVGRPLLDDHTFLSYLHNRYQGDIQATAIDLILASFDILANAVFRRETHKTGYLLRSYLINKVPLLLANLATSMFPPLTPQFCIAEAMNQVDTNAFPSMSEMFDLSNDNRDSVTENVRADFCFACCLHGLISEDSINSLIGDMHYQTLPAGGRYVKEALVAECMTDPERVQKLIGEMENYDGNVGAACQAVTEVIGRLCNEKETMTLKNICGQLAKKPLSMDVMLLFDKPATFLHPLCELLDNWHYDEDQGEYQPVYEEFGSILLLVLAFAYRYNLTAADLGIQAPQSFVANLLNKGQWHRSLDELSEQEKGHLGGWIQGLFDNEAGGLGDELMSSCPPQDFYMLVPSLFHNMVLAFSVGYLQEESLKTGMEYLVDTFLLPCLVMAINYMATQLWNDRKDERKAAIRILQLILLTKHGSNEAQTMLSAVLNVVAKPLENALRLYQRQDPQSQEVDPLLNAIKENIRLSRRTAGAGHNDLESWASTPGGGLAAAVRHTIQALVQWATHPGPNIAPTSYTHRQMLAASRMLGAKRLLYIILDEVKQQTETAMATAANNANSTDANNTAATTSASVVHDVALALICAPDVSNVPPPTMMAILAAHPSEPSGQQQQQQQQQQPQYPIPPQTSLSLRAVLKAEAEDFKTIQKTDALLADIIVRLYRRVEAQLHVPEPVANAMAAAEAEAAAVNEMLDAAAAAELSTLGLPGADGGGGGGGVDGDDATAAAADAFGVAGAGNAGQDQGAGAAGGLDNAFDGLGDLGDAGDLGGLGGLDGLDGTGVGGGGAGGGGMDLGGTDDDIFSGLEGVGSSADLLQGWDGMDFS
ncbi:mediator complex, subunit Med5 [Microdochium trichocladiopsis]|uniref:Mediator of RNA polymerase II transcription subunit 5 n=1 Tax=Microdochium trichocladiopsis TaxID=1682393 RepID=A0A9P8Y9N1_9PEZI|nr:mediator complex, subunit Med5 [Microdochium trichocladiopsis]KAH7033246.1 mediator complex, subunit Med5 [Microdochium trichocladiopsis]